MSTPSIQDLIRNNLSIPTLPDVVSKINGLIADPSSGTADLGELVSEDAPLAAKVLRIANSAYYGLTSDCVSTEQASTVLGMKVLKNIVTQVAVINQFDHVQGNEHFSIQGLWNHAGFTAHLCSILAQKSKVLRAFKPDELYVCGLLHDVGKIVLLDGLGERYLDLAEKAANDGHSMYRTEKVVLGYAHTDVGAVVANRWGLPEQIAKAIQYHHGPREEISKNVVVSLVAHANLLAHRIKEGREASEAIFDADTQTHLGLIPADVGEILDFAEENQNMRSV